MYLYDKNLMKRDYTIWIDKIGKERAELEVVLFKSHHVFVRIGSEIS